MHFVYTSVYYKGMKLIFALGNPGERYATTRHSIGFAVADKLTQGYAADWRVNAKFKAVVAEFIADGIKVILAKPTTYYNEVGQSYQAISSYYGVKPEDTLVVHDDLALPFGTIRTRTGGSGGGSKGIRSLNAHGGDQTCRLRIGISNDLAPQIDSADFVLSRFTKSEAEALETTILPKATQIIDDFITGQHEPTSYSL